MIEFFMKLGHKYQLLSSLLRDTNSPSCEVSMVYLASFHASPFITFIIIQIIMTSINWWQIIVHQFAATSQPSQLLPLKSWQSSPKEVSLICQDKLAPQTVQNWQSWRSPGFDLCRYSAWDFGTKIFCFHGFGLFDWLNASRVRNFPVSQFYSSFLGYLMAGLL